MQLVSLIVNHNVVKKNFCHMNGINFLRNLMYATHKSKKMDDLLSIVFLLIVQGKTLMHIIHKSIVFDILCA